MNKQTGFTLIELMIVVAIIAILAAIALPAYSDYTRKAKVSEVITSASSGRTAVSEYVASNGSCPSANILPTQSSKYVSKVENANCVITATSQNIPGVSGTIVLTGTADSGSGIVDWTCSGGIDSKYRPGSCQGVKN